MINSPPILLNGSRVQLELFNETHRNSLFKAAQDQKIWTYNASKAFGDHFSHWFEKALHDLQKKQQLPFIVHQVNDQKIVGSTRFYDINLDHNRLAIGYTWYIPEVWGTFINPECKYLLLKYAFEDLQMNRVEFITDARNARSRAAIKKLGASEEGTMRHHMVLEDGSFRDSVLFSIIQSEWPQVKAKLLSRIK